MYEFNVQKYAVACMRLAAELNGKILQGAETLDELQSKEHNDESSCSPLHQ
jgi:hypothetical protein